MRFFWQKKGKTEKRNLAVSEVYISQTQQPIWTNWTTRKAVDEGLKTNGWVYKAVTLIANAAASVPWVVRDGNGETIPEHHLAQLLRYPNPKQSRQKYINLLVNHLQLAGNAYSKKVTQSGRTVELWPISPDRIHPVPGKNIEDWVIGYAVDNNTIPAWGAEEIVHHLFQNPKNPFIGFSPLEVAARAVDTDNSMQGFNASTAQNQGVASGVFTFEREFHSQDDADTVRNRLQESYGKNRGFIVLGSNAKFTQLSMTPAEMDFIDSRKQIRDEIFIVFGVPPQYAGALESSTYNNYQVSEVIFWGATIIPLLENIADTFNLAFREELNTGEKIGYDLSRVAAVRAAQDQKTKIAKNLFEMGVPVSEINRIFDLSLNEYAGWEKSKFDLEKQAETEIAVRRRRNRLTLQTPWEQRATAENETARESQERENARVIGQALEAQKRTVFELLEQGAEVGEIETAIQNDQVFEAALLQAYADSAVRLGREVVIEKRESEEIIRERVAEILEDEAVILAEKSKIDETTISKIIDSITEGLEGGLAINEIQNLLIDSGIFSPERALLISETVTANATGLGQKVAAEEAGAKEKEWVTGGFNVREGHQARNGERVPIDARFSSRYGGRPRWPGDHTTTIADRARCKCALVFHLSEEN